MSEEHKKEERPQIELRCNVDTSMLGLLRDFVSNVSRYLGFPEEQITEIEICVDEVCANAIEHAYEKAFECSGGTCDRDLHVELRFSGSELTIRVIDHGKGAQESFLRLHKLEEYLDSTREKYRGLGFYLIHKFMDKVSVQTAPGKGTTVEMTKFRK